MSVMSEILGTDDISFLRSQSVQLVLLVSVVSSMGSVASPALPAMTDALSISPARIGLVFTAYTLPGVFLLPAVGVVAGVYGQRLVVSAGLVLFGAAGLAVGLVTDFEVILLLRALQGCGYAAFNPLTVSLLGDLLTGHEEAASQGVRALLNKVSGFLGPTIGGVLAAVAWYYPFYLYGVAVPVGIVVYFALSVRSEGGETGDGSQDAGTVDEDGSTNREEIHRYFRDLIGVFRRPSIGLIVLGGFFRMFLKYTLYTFLALAVANQFGADLGTAGLLVGIYSLTGAIVGTQSARFTQNLGHMYALLWAFILASAAFVVFPLVDSLVLVGLLVVIHGIGEGIINPIHKSILTQSVGKDARVGLVTSNGIAQSIGRTVTPVVLSPLLLFDGWDYTHLFFVSGSLTLLISIGVFFIVVTTGAESPVKR